jgi:hypothetical protein
VELSINVPGAVHMTVEVKSIRSAASRNVAIARAARLES